MKTLWIRLPNINIVERFVAACTQFNAQFEVSAGEQTADAKSMLGLLSLNLSGPLELRIHAEQESIPGIVKVLEPYCI